MIPRNTLLPSDIWGLVMACLPLHDLLSTSLVSWAWNNLTFSKLYRTLYISKHAHLIDLAKRVTSDKRLPAVTRGLVVDGEISFYLKGDYIREDDHEFLLAILSALSGLVLFSWELSSISENSEVINLLQDRYPNLQSFHYTLWHPDSKSFSDHYVRFANFRNLHHLSLNLMILSFALENAYNQSLAILVRACTQLRSLTLRVDEYSGPTESWSPIPFLENIQDVIIPSLHTFRLLGAIKIDESFFESPDSDPLCQFFVRHPALCTIGLGWDVNFYYWDYIEPNDMADLFPSVTDFEAPAYLCVPVLMSRLASQIESVTINDGWFGYTEPLEDLAEGIKSLPVLKKLAFDGSGEEDGAKTVPAVLRLLSTSPQLEEFEFYVPPKNFGTLTSMLQIVPRLKVFSVCTGLFNYLDPDVGPSGEEHCVLLLAQACPGLRKVCGPSKRGTPYWEFERGDGGDIRVIKTE